MQYSDRITAIEVRAARINRTLRRLCMDAGVDYGNLYRWRSKLCSPTLDLFEDTMTKLDGKLSELEAEILHSIECPEEAPRRSA